MVCTSRLRSRLAIAPGKELRNTFFHGQPDVILGEALRCGARAGEVIEFRELATMVEGVFVGEFVQHGGHPPRKPLHFPYTAQAGLGVLLQGEVPARSVKIAERFGEHLYIGNS